jgi:DMSO/TMAO reductase YedYZ molybdopterin-dependent catalytic subunit
VASNAVEVVFEGADSGTVADPPSPGPISFARSLPLAKARRPEVMLAWAMNGQPLTPRHGAPLRVVVGGWYGMASIKWLKRILVVTEPFQGFYQTLDYSYFRRVGGVPTLTPITVMQVKSQIARPAPHDVIPAGRPYTILGAAWAGENAISRVELSIDNGKTWSDAQLSETQAPFCWRLWQFVWDSPRRGTVRLMARATDDHGNTQPMQRDPDRRTYMISHVVPVEVEVR